MDALPHRLTALAALSFIAVAFVQTWPLALHVSTDVTGFPGGDAGVYLWNVWHFRHQLLDVGASPFWTDRILTLAGPTNLALHNYTVFADAIAVLPQPFVGVVAAFNLVYLLNVALCGLGMFLLAQRLTGRVAEAWLAGVMFAWAPFLVARGASHFSLAAAAPLPLFVYWTDRAWAEERMRDAAAAGATIAWAFYCDPYYAVYAVMLLAIYVASRFVGVERRREPTSRMSLARRTIDMAIGAIGVTIVAVYVVAGGSISIGDFTIAMRTLYTPMFVLAALLVVRIALRWRVSVCRPVVPPNVARLGAVLLISATVLLVPELYALARMAATDQLVDVPVLWRSSAPGVDALAFLIPNPNHPLAPSFVRDWLAHQPGGFDENVAALSYVAMVVILVAWRRAGFAPAGMWLATMFGFASIAVGPFLKVAGVPTFFPTPWSVLRYIPIVGEARMPQRFSIAVFLALTVLFAAALAAIGRRWPHRRRAAVSLVGIALVIELWPVPRTLFATGVPGVFRVIAADTRPVTVLELPFGLRDGLSSLGNFGASSLFFQTLHGKALIGGYVSRLDERTKLAYQDDPVTRAFIEFAEQRSPTAELIAAASTAAPSFIERTKLGYVVIDRDRVTPEERRFAMTALGLERVDAPLETGARELYRVPSAF